MLKYINTFIKSLRTPPSLRLDIPHTPYATWLCLSAAGR